jgi:hypothetical protein
LPSGCRLDLINPTPFDWQDEDLALRMARTYRWSGESIWPVPMSVAQHALMVLAMQRQWSASLLSPMAMMRELHHDSDEGLLGFDCSAVLKPILGAPFAEVSRRLLQAVFIRYGITPWTPEEKIVHKKADRIAAASEAVHVVGWSRDEVRSVLRIEYKPLDTDPLEQVYGDEPWAPWPADVAAERFLAEMKDIEVERRRQEAVTAAANVTGLPRQQSLPV